MYVNGIKKHIIQTLSLTSVFLFLLGCSLDYEINGAASSSLQILSVSPVILSVSGGESLKITGSGFKSGDSILVGSKACLNSVVESDTVMTCTTPSNTSVEAVDVRVVRSGQSVLAQQRPMVSVILGGAANGGYETLQRNLAAPWTIKQVAGKIYFANLSHYKINILNSLPTQNYPAFDSVLGQLTLEEVSMPGFKVNQRYSFGAMDFDYDGSHFVVADANQHRILIWNSLPTSPTQPADLILGQTSLVGKDANGGGAVGASTFNAPRGIRLAGGKLIVADTLNHRVLIWNAVPTENVGADVVLGQGDFISNTKNAGGISASSLNSPYHIELADSKLLVADTSNNRVLIWNNFPTQNQAPADVVLGQSLFSTATVNNGGLSAKSLRSPAGLYYHDSKLYVADLTNNRILIWNTLPVANFAAANLVLGQSLFTTSTAGATSTSMTGPSRIQVIEGKLVISDSGNNRVLFYSDVPTASGAAASIVVGQPTMTDSLLRNPNKALGMVNVTGVATDGTRLVVADKGKNRVLIWNSMPSSSDQEPDVILGQANLNTYTRAPSPTASSMTNPHGVLIVGDKLYLADSGNNRILIWNSWPTVNNQAADVVLGQTLMTTNTANNGGVSATSLSSPFGLSSDGTRFLVSEWGNNRVLMWNSLPAVNATPADVVVGQPNMASNTNNNGGVSASSMWQPYQARIFDGKLFVADKSNSRLLIFNSIPTTHGAAADVVVGQSNMTSNLLHQGTGEIGDSTLSSPMDMFVDSGKLHILEDISNRILVFDSVPMANDSKAVSTMGSSTLTTYVPADPKGFGWPNAMVTTADKLIIADYINGRILILPKN